MKTHPEQELLSAFVDGELTEREQVMLEAHLASCADCREVLGALRATLGDLALVPEAVPSERDSWVLRSAIAKERRLDRRGRRWYLISGSAAAAVVAILAFALSSGGGSGARLRAHGPGALTSLSLQHNSVNYTDSSARAVLLRFSSVTDEGAVYDAKTGTTGGAGAGGFSSDTPPSTGGPSQELAVRSSSGVAKSAGADEAALNRCVDTVYRSSSKPLTPRYYEAARFDGEPAFVLVFEATEAQRLELWVLRQRDCFVEFWAQTRA